jgi:Trypsin
MSLAARAASLAALLPFGLASACAACAACAAFAACAFGAAGCVVRKATNAVRPAAHQAPSPDEVDSEPKVGRYFTPPIALAVPEDAIVRVIGPQMTCSGTLVEDDLVLTAHHCVVARGKHGEFTKGLLSGKDMKIELGGDYLAWGRVGVSHVVAPPCGEEGGAGDIAILVLERKVVGLGTMTARLDRPPRVGEPVDPAGFGRCSGDGIHRSVRTGGAISSVGIGTVAMTASVCPGDSGGPILARGTQEVVGVVSLSAMDSDERTSSPSIMARIDSYRMVFANARLIADGMPAAEIPPLSCAR